MRSWFAIMALAMACGGGSGGTHATSTPTGRAASRDVIASMRERLKSFCGAALKDDACEMTKVGEWRGQMKLELSGKALGAVKIELLGPSADVSAMRKRALEAAGDLIDDAQRPAIEEALSRLYHDVFTSEASGWAGDLFVTAATGMDPAQPEQRHVRLELATAATVEPGAHEPLAKAAPAKEFASPAKATSEPWMADVKAACTDMVNFVSKTHQVPADPPKWIQDDVHISCVHPNETAVAQFVVTWAPATKRLIYARFVVEMPQKKFAALTDRVLAPLLSPKQTTVMKTAAKKEPTDRKFEADGFQLGSRHETGGFYGETHELELSVIVGWTDSP